MAAGKRDKKDYICKGKIGKYCCSRIIIIIILLLTSSCGYRFIGRDISASHHRNISIPILYNDTFEPLLEIKVTHFLKKELISRGEWEIENNPGSADIVLKGKITSFGTKTIAIDSQGRASEYRVTIKIEVNLEDLRRKKALIEKRAISAAAEYFASSNITADRDAKDRAIEAACKILGEEVIEILLETL